MISFRCTNIDFYKSLDYPITVVSTCFPGYKSTHTAKCYLFPDLSFTGDSEQAAIVGLEEILQDRIQEMIETGSLVPLPVKYHLFGLEFLSQLRSHYMPGADYEPTDEEHLSWQEKFQQVSSDSRLASLVLELDRACRANKISRNAISTLIINLGMLEEVEVSV